MKLIIICIAALALAFAPAARACPPDVVPDDGGSFSSFGGGYGAGACEAPMIAGNFGGGYGGYGGYGGPMVAAPSYSASYYAMPVGGFGRPRFRGGFRGGYGGGFRGSFRGGYGGAIVAAPVRVHYAAPVVAAPVVAAPVYGAVVAPRAPGPFRGAVQGFFGGLRNKLNGF